MAAIRLSSLWLATLVILSGPALATAQRGLADDPNGENLALLVGVSHGLPGIDIDVNNLEAMSTKAEFNFKTSRLEDEEGTGENVTARLGELSKSVGKVGGTLLFYYTGHGSPGSLYLQDGSTDIADIRDAIEGNLETGDVLDRFVFIIDACFSGSLLDPMNVMQMSHEMKNTLMVQSVMDALAPKKGRDNYWKKLFVFASSKADETSLAGWDGSVFTNALVKGFTEAATNGGTMGDWVSLTQKYTEGHHPVARFAPSSLENEALIP